MDEDGTAEPEPAGPWVAVSRAAVPDAGWEREVAGVRVSGGAALSPEPATARRSTGTSAGASAVAELSAWIRAGDPAVLRLVAVDELAVGVLVGALEVLPVSVRVVVVDGTRFAVDDPTGRACWRLVLAGLAAHVQSRMSARAPDGSSPARAEANTSATSIATPAGSAGSQVRWPGHRQLSDRDLEEGRRDRAAGMASAAIVATAPGLGSAGAGDPGAGAPATGVPGTAALGAGDGGHQGGQHPDQIAQEGDVERDAAGAARGAAVRADVAGVDEGIRPGIGGRLPAVGAADGGRSAVAVPVSPGKGPGKGVRGGT
ncbi:hypothetical protein [Geodermatophilus africanus]|uniref:hypothetical protein n=1 Tax=Geodermatophilus africanus TaxID=1137993 RepID=UPI000B88EE82|nr:hypothetical protein [Geodermatophilus africanus]